MNDVQSKLAEIRGATAPTGGTPSSAPLGTMGIKRGLQPTNVVPIMAPAPVSGANDVQAKLAQIRASKAPAPAPVAPPAPSSVFGNPLETIKNAGEGVYSAITGTGEDQGKSPLERGFGATSKAFMAVPGVVADVIPGGNTVMKGLGTVFGKATDFAGNISDTLDAGAVKAGLMPESQRQANQKSASEFANSKTGEAVRATASIGESSGNIANTILGAKGTVDTLEKVPSAVKTVKDAGAKAVQATGEGVGKVLTKTPDQIVAKRVEELGKIANNYQKLRKADRYSPDSGLESRTRIANTDVLSGSVDSSGTLRTTQKGGPIDQYKAQTIDGAENLVRNNLKRLGETVPLKTVEKALNDNLMKSGLEGSDLKNGLNRIKSEISGLRLRADAQGNVPLYKVHDAKINTTNGIDYLTPANTKVASKAIAEAYKTIVENNTKFNVKPVNAELGKYLKDINFLENLDGKKVEGGRLSKHFAVLAGNVVGGAVGSLMGPIGTAGGAIAGGEVARAIKGKSFERTFGPKAGVSAPENPIIKEAVKESKKPQLMLPAPKEGAPRTTSYGSTPIPVLPKGSNAEYTGAGASVGGADTVQSKSLGSLNTMYKTPPTSATKAPGVIPESIAPKKKVNDFIPTITPDKSLTGNDAKVQDASIKKVTEQRQSLINKYLKDNGNIVNTDNARKLFADVGYNGNNSASVHEASSHISNAVFDHLIATKAPGEAYFLAGGSGAGKSTGTRAFESALKDASVVLDGNLSNYEKSANKIKRAEDLGHKPGVLYVYRDPIEAWKNGVIKRMLGTGTDAGRVVPLKEFLSNTVGALSTVKRLITDGIPVAGWENTNIGQGKDLPPNEIKKLEIAPDIQEKLTKATEQMASVGSITEEQYTSLMHGLPHTPFSELAK